MRTAKRPTSSTGTPITHWHSPALRVFKARFYSSYGFSTTSIPRAYPDAVRKTVWRSVPRIRDELRAMGPRDVEDGKKALEDLDYPLIVVEGIVGDAWNWMCLNMQKGRILTTQRKIDRDSSVLSFQIQSYFRILDAYMDL